MTNDLFTKFSYLAYVGLRQIFSNQGISRITFSIKKKVF